MSKRQDGIREIHYRDSAKQGENQHLRSEKELPKKIPQQKQQVDWYHGNPENMLKTFIFGWLYCYTVDGSEILHQFLLQTESLNESTWMKLPKTFESVSIYVQLMLIYLVVWGQVVWDSTGILSTNPFHKGIPEIQTTNTNYQLTTIWLEFIKKTILAMPLLPADVRILSYLTQGSWLTFREW